MKKKFVVVGVLGTLVVGALAIAYARSSASRGIASGLDAAREEAKKLGLPTTMDEVPEATVPADKNAAPGLLEASRMRKSNPEAVPDILIDASSRPMCQFDWKDVQRPGYIAGLKLRDCVGLLMESAAADFKSGKDLEGRRKLTRALVLARMLEQVPTDEGLRESLMVERSIYEHIGTTMVENPANGDLMVAVQTETFYARGVKALVGGMRSFVALGDQIASEHEAAGGEKLSWIWRQGDFPTDPWGRSAVETVHLQQAVALMKEINVANTWPEAMDIVNKRVGEWHEDARPSAYSLRVSSKRIEDLAKLATENEAARRALFVAAAAFRQNIASNQFPPKSPVMGEMSFDVFTGEPMHYSNLGTGFSLRSVGADKLDAGGNDKEGLIVGGDIGFRYDGRPEVKN